MSPVTRRKAWGKAAILEVTPQIIATLSSQNNPPGILGVFRQRWAKELTPNGLWLALEDIRDPGNLGTIIRTADAVKASGVVLVGECCDPWGPDCVRATTGSIFGVPLIRMTKAQFAAAAREWPGDVVGTAMSASNDFRRAYAAPTLSGHGQRKQRPLAGTFRRLLRSGPHSHAGQNRKPQRRRRHGPDALRNRKPWPKLVNSPHQPRQISTTQNHSNC